MGNCILSRDSKNGFKEEHLDYLRDKFDIMSEDGNMVAALVADAYRCSLKEAELFMAWIDLSG